jgi:hypothetical protein
VTENQNRYIKKDYIFLSKRGKTPNLKKGDFVLYRGPEYDGDVIAIVFEVTSSTKAGIYSLEDYNNMFNTRTYVVKYNIKWILKD